jgi:ribosomal protein S12 methylthiotransferase accessory factor
LTLPWRDATVSVHDSATALDMNSRDDPQMAPLAELLRAAAAILVGGAAVPGPPRDFLARLDYFDDTPEHAPHRAAMLHAAAGFVRIFTLEEPQAPGLVAVGAEVDPARVGVPGEPLASVAGTGLTFRQAFESCVGEGVERLSQFATDQDAITLLTPADALEDASPALRALWERLQPYRRDSCRCVQPASRTAWVTAADLTDGTPVRLPADLCVRRPAEQRDLDPPWPLSIGCGAGPDHLTATLSALLELVERDAVALWWRGGRRARLLPGDLGAAVLARLRGGGTQRRSWFLDITTDTAIPAVVAASCNDDGFGLCCGFAARTTLAAAAEAAALEMAQMELAHRITAAKRATRGEAALNEADWQHLRRFACIDVTRTPALHPLAPPLPPGDPPAQHGGAALAALRQRLDAVGVAPCALDLTRATFGVPVVRVVCAGLEAGWTSPPGPRLRRAAELSGVDPADAPPL